MLRFDEIFVFQMHATMLADILQEICTDYIDQFPHQMNTISLYKKLVAKRYIENDTRRKRIARSVEEFNQLKSMLEVEANYETNPDLMRVFMNLSVFAWYKMISEHAVALCTGTYAWTVTRPLDLSQNRTFLGNLFG